MRQGTLIRESSREPLFRIWRPCAVFGLFVGMLVSFNTVWAQDVPDANQAAKTAQAEGNPSAPAGKVSVRPLVSFDDGQLTINANNVSLPEIMSALRACMGVDIDIPTNASAERVTAQLGPGPARKVLADLLGWSSFDYIIQGSDEDPLAVQSVTLLERSKGPVAPSPRSTGVVASAHAPANVPSAPQPEAEPAASNVTEPAVAEVRPDRSDAIPDQPSNASGLPSSLQSRIAASGSNTAAGPGLNSSVGQSPAEMIQQLQQMYEQRRILQQQENQSAGRSGH
jgi:hypothetical protein